MTANEEQGPRRRHGRHALIPAGLLIGLGAGLITGYPWSGALIGLGLGFLAQGFLKSAGGRSRTRRRRGVPVAAVWFLRLSAYS